MIFTHNGDTLNAGAVIRKRKVWVWVRDQDTKLTMMSDEYDLEPGDTQKDIKKYERRAMRYYKGVQV